MTGAGVRPSGIHVASRPVHGDRWKTLRDVHGYPIVSTWIDVPASYATLGRPGSLADAVAQAAGAAAMVFYREKGEDLGPAWIEAAAALAAGVPVLAVGFEAYGLGDDCGMRTFGHQRDAFAEAKRIAAEAELAHPVARPAS